MCLHGLVAQEEPECDLSIREALRDEAEDLGLPRREGVELVRWRLRAGSQTRELGYQPARDGRCEQRLTGGDDANSLEEGLGRRVLQQEPTRTRLEGVVDIFVEI